MESKREEEIPRLKKKNQKMGRLIIVQDGES